MIQKGYLAIITARSGSQRLPNKNIRDFLGKPLFVWSILAGIHCPEVTETIVSTDSEIYQKIAINYGATCGRLRAAQLASAEATSVDVVKDVLDNYPGVGEKFKGIILLQPTSPLRIAEDISAAIKIYEVTHPSAVVSVCETECPPAWIGQLGQDYLMDSFISPALKGLRSQDFGIWYRLNGAIYLIGIEKFKQELDFMPAGTKAYIMPRERSIDIDNESDFNLALALKAREILV